MNRISRESRMTGLQRRLSEIKHGAQRNIAQDNRGKQQ